MKKRINLFLHQIQCYLNGNTKLKNWLWFFALWFLGLGFTIFLSYGTKGLFNIIRGLIS